MIIDVDTEDLLITYLMANIGFSIPIATRIERLGSDPNQRPPESIVLVRTGGPRRDFVTDQPSIAVDVRAKTETRAVTIINAVRALLNDLPGLEIAGHAVYSCQEFSGPTNQPTDVDPIRYSQSFSIAIRS